MVSVLDHLLTAAITSCMFTKKLPNIVTINQMWIYKRMNKIVKDNLSCQTGSAMVLNRLGCSVVPFVSRQID